MREAPHSTFQLITGILALVVIPLYLGLAHIMFTQLLLYLVVAGTGMAVGELLLTPKHRRPVLALFMQQLFLSSLVAIVIGGLTYLVAQMF